MTANLSEPPGRIFVDPSRFRRLPNEKPCYEDMVSLTGYFHCRHCGAVLKPLPGDCCVFCSYGDVPCPPIQEVRVSGRDAGCCG